VNLSLLLLRGNALYAFLPHFSIYISFLHHPTQPCLVCREDAKKEASEKPEPRFAAVAIAGVTQRKWKEEDPTFE
jgi:hypothetical protein